MMKLSAALLLLATSGAAAAQSMPLSTFLAKAAALEKKGAMAIFSGDLKLLQKEGMAAGKAIRADQLAAVKAGRKPATCLPAKASIGTGETLAYFRAVPPAQRGMTVKTALTGLMNKKYPCPA